jgi:GH24 family phage-related lysozyme (muramidase)
MKHLIGLIAICVLIFVTIAHCNVKKKKTVIKKELFTSTQQYQIMCWIIKKSENYRADVYRCQARKKTTGWGFTTVKSVKDIHHADEIFKNIVNPLYEKVNEEYPTLPYLHKAVIVSLLYNTGDLKGIKKSKFAKSLVKNDINNAVAAFKAWNKVKIKKGKYIVSKGLVKRRTYEAKLLDNTFTMNDYNKLKSEISQIYKENRS